MLAGWPWPPWNSSLQTGLGSGSLGRSEQTRRIATWMLGSWSALWKWSNNPQCWGLFTINLSSSTLKSGRMLNKNKIKPPLHLNYIQHRPTCSLTSPAARVCSMPMCTDDGTLLRLLQLAEVGKNGEESSNLLQFNLEICTNNHRPYFAICRITISIKVTFTSQIQWIFLIRFVCLFV